MIASRIKGKRRKRTRDEPKPPYPSHGECAFFFTLCTFKFIYNSAPPCVVCNLTVTVPMAWPTGMCCYFSFSSVLLTGTVVPSSLRNRMYSATGSRPNSSKSSLAAKKRRESVCVYPIVQQSTDSFLAA